MDGSFAKRESENQANPCHAIQTSNHASLHNSYKPATSEALAFIYVLGYCLRRTVYQGTTLQCT